MPPLLRHFHRFGQFLFIASASTQAFLALPSDELYLPILGKGQKASRYPAIGGSALSPLCFSTNFHDEPYLRDREGRPVIMFFDMHSFSREEIKFFRETVEKKNGRCPVILGMGREDPGDGEWRYIGAAPGFDPKFWDERVSRGIEVVPDVTIGKNDSPRYTNPPEWGNAGMDKEILRNEEIESALTQAIEWTVSKKNKLIVHSLLIYAWDEYAEGGWLCPTYNDNGEIDSSRLAVVKKVMNRIKNV